VRERQTQCNVVQHSVPHCNSLQLSATPWARPSTRNSFGFMCERQTHCNTLQHAATRCNTLQHTATHCNTLHHTATHCAIGFVCERQTHCNTLQHIATHCNTLHHTASHCNTLCNWVRVRETDRQIDRPPDMKVEDCYKQTHRNTLQHAATHCNTLQHTATHCTRRMLKTDAPQRTATRCNTLQHTATHRTDGQRESLRQTGSEGESDSLTLTVRVREL